MKMVRTINATRSVTLVAVLVPACVALAGGEPGDVDATGLPLDQTAWIEVDPVNLEVVLAEDVERELAGLPPRFAIPRTTSITPKTHGRWEDLDHEVRRWHLRISSPGALSLNLGFTRYFMPPGGRLFVHATDLSYSIRPFTERDNAEHGELWTPVVLADDIVVEVTVPKQAVDRLDLELTSINVGYRGFGELLVDRSGSCNVDVICPEGDDWRNEIATVGVISTGGSTFCTGFMVNNTAEDLVPFFMTAKHCGVSSGVAPSLVVYWNYENSWCRPPGSPESGAPGDGSLSQFQTGSFFRSAYSASDFTLVELDEDPDPAWNVGYAGWDRSSYDATSAVAIHHPNTDEKRISFEYQPTTTTGYLGTSVPGDGTHVRVEDWDLGTTEPGSSGSPLFDQNHRIVGQLHGGYASCTSQTSDWYGRFSVSWTGGGSASTRLSDWLDPLGTGQMTTDFRSMFMTALTIELPEGTPWRVDPEVPTTITVRIEDGGETVVPGTETLHYRFDPGAAEYLASPLAPLGGDLYEATLPAASCGQQPEFYFSAAGDGGTTVYEPLDAPASVYSAVVATLTVILEDDFEADQGWSVEDIDIASGSWERGIPAGDGTRGDPLTDFDGSGQCYLTGNALGNSDVDGGPTRLISPIIDLSGTVGPVVRYARWFTCDDDLPPAEDLLDVEISDDDGGSWQLIETVAHTEGWVYGTIDVADYVELTDQIRIRFSAMDNPNNSVTEAAVDAVEVFDLACFESGNGDFNGDSDVDLADFGGFQICFGQSAAGDCIPGNLAGGPTIDLDDFAAFPAVFGGPTAP